MCRVHADWTPLRRARSGPTFRTVSDLSCDAAMLYPFAPGLLRARGGDGRNTPQLATNPATGRPLPTKPPCHPAGRGCGRGTRRLFWRGAALDCSDVCTRVVPHFRAPCLALFVRRPFRRPGLAAQTFPLLRSSRSALPAVHAASCWRAPWLSQGPVGGATRSCTPAWRMRQAGLVD